MISTRILKSLHRREQQGILCSRKFQETTGTGSIAKPTEFIQRDGEKLWLK